LIINVQVSQVPEFEEAAFSAPLNKVVRCKTKFGWHLLQVISERYAKESYSI
jgi:parvulin-like peptidyl-prolyl isomerase